MADWRRRSKEHIREYVRRPDIRQRVLARDLLNKAVKSGRLVRPSTCERCHSCDRPIEAHHPDYSKPLQVHWLCNLCHDAERRVS